jgi:hypothetical protein
LHRVSKRRLNATKRVCALKFKHVRNEKLCFMRHIIWRWVKFLKESRALIESREANREKKATRSRFKCAAALRRDRRTSTIDRCWRTHMPRHSCRTHTRTWRTKSQEQVKSHTLSYVHKYGSWICN